MEKKKVSKFVKFDSFEHFKNFNSSEKEKLLEKIKSKSQNLQNSNKYNNYEKKVIQRALDDLFSENSVEKFKLKNNTIIVTHLLILDVL